MRNIQYLVKKFMMKFKKYIDINVIIIEVNQKLDLGFEITNLYYMVGGYYCFIFLELSNQIQNLFLKMRLKKFVNVKLYRKDYLKFSKKLRKVKVTMKFGRIFIEVKVVHIIKENEIKIIFTIQ